MASVLSSMKMPKKRQAEQEADADLEMLGLGEESDMAATDAVPSREAVDSGDLGHAGSESVLSDVSDDELLAELRARGLSPDESEDETAEMTEDEEDEEEEVTADDAMV